MVSWLRMDRKGSASVDAVLLLGRLVKSLERHLRMYSMNGFVVPKTRNTSRDAVTPGMKRRKSCRARLAEMSG
ncbi:hypothetical protein COL940_011714, partial [Colletotrichum noveboracense]